MFTLIVTVTPGNPIVIANDYTAELAERQRDSLIAGGKVLDACVIPTGPEPNA
jgi:hypothetical protein